MNGNIVERVAAIVQKVGTANSTPLVSSYVSAKNAGQIMALLLTGDMANETVDFAIYQATDTSGTGAKVCKAITQLAASATANDNGVVKIGIDATELDIANSFTCVAARCVTGGATGGTVGMVLLVEPSRYGPASKIEPAAVLQTKI
jgi:hypothetical protein